MGISHSESTCADPRRPVSYSLLILRAALQQLAPSGRLIYSSCSLKSEENQAVVEEVLHTGAKEPAALPTFASSIAGKNRRRSGIHAANQLRRVNFVQLCVIILQRDGESGIWKLWSFITRIHTIPRCGRPAYWAGCSYAVVAVERGRATEFASFSPVRRGRREALRGGGNCEQRRRESSPYFASGKSNDAPAPRCA